MVDQPKTFRVSAALWAQAAEIAKTRGETVADVLRDALRRYVRRNRGTS